MRLSLIGAPMFAAGCAESPAPSGSQPLGLGEQRDGVLYVPSRYRRSVPAPLILYLHGAGGSGSRAMERLVEDAERTGSIVIAPDSRGRTWGAVTGDEEPDLAFIDDALEAAFASYAIDRRRVGIAGFSDGASAALSLGLVKGDVFTAIAAFSPGFVRVSSPPNGSPRIFISHGTGDTILPIERCGRRIARELRAAGYTVEYREFDGEHTIPPEIRSAGIDWLVRA